MILFTESSHNVGGQELQLLAQARGLAARGIEVRLACPPASRIAALATEFGVPVSPVEFRYSLHLPSILAVMRLISEWRPAAVLCHSAHDAYVCAVAARLVPPRPRLVRMRTYQQGLPNAWTYNRLFDRTLVPSEEMRRRLLANPRVRPERIGLLHPGIAFASIEARSRQPLDAGVEETLARFPARRITHAAMLRPEKGHLLMLEVLAALRMPDLCYVIAGEGEMKAAIQAKTRALGLERHVCLLGMVRNAPALFAKSELVVMPSLDEPLGMSQIEALGLGVPVVASRVGGIPETMEDVLVSPGDIHAWTQALAWALANPAKMRELAAAGRTKVRQRFELDNILDQLVGHLS